MHAMYIKYAQLHNLEPWVSSRHLTGQRASSITLRSKYLKISKMCVCANCKNFSQTFAVNVKSNDELVNNKQFCFVGKAWKTFKTHIKHFKTHFKTFLKHISNITWQVSTWPFPPAQRKEEWSSKNWEGGCDWTVLWLVTGRLWQVVTGRLLVKTQNDEDGDF